MSSSPLAASLIEEYVPLAGAYDELLTDSGDVRVAYQQLIEILNQAGKEEISQRWEQAQRLVDANGFAYGLVTPKDKPRPWELDAMPLVMSSMEWQNVSAALKQRAQVLNLVLQDLFGPQNLLTNGLLPPEIVFSHPGFLRPYHGQNPAQNCFLHFHAADMARSPDGRWWVLADRTEAPSGLGYALENRVVISRMLPDAFQQCQIQRLAPFFIAAQETLRGLAPDHRENPHVVLLSEGPTSRNYIEDAYLARYLGYTLVEGGDLAVRNKQVMLKTLGGLQPVDVIMRRQNSCDCDPLELDAGSGLGVAGLVEAARSGSVAIANPFGSGLVESPVFLTFLPQLCQSFLGEDLRMPSVATWWCGRPDSLEFVLENLDGLDVQPAFRCRGKDTTIREKLNELPPAKLAERIRTNPAEYVAQEKVVRSCTSVWGQPIQTAHVAVRAYSVAAGSSYKVMQGGLARISSTLDRLDISIQKGEGSKDIWIRAEGPVDHVTLLGEPDQTITLRRSGAELPSRVADNIFWLGRNLERAEALARLLRATASRMTGETRSTSDLEIPVLLRCLADQGLIEPDYAVDKLNTQLPAIEYSLPSSIFDAERSTSLRSLLDEIFRLGLIVRDRMSLDTWRIIHRIDKGFVPIRRGTTNLTDLLEMTDELITELAALSGIVMESMTRAQAFRFLELGRRLERSMQTIGLVHNCLIPLPDVLEPVLETVLEVADSLMTYRSRYLANLRLAAVLDLLLTDESNPRSLAYQFVQLHEHVDQLPRDRSQPGYTFVQRAAMSLLHSIRTLDIQFIAESHAAGDYHRLETLALNWDTDLPRLSEAISHQYLIHAGPAHQLSKIRPK